MDEDEYVVPTNTIERRDAKIAELEKNAAEANELRESLVKMKAELNLAVKTTYIAKNKLKFARKVTEERLKECLPVPNFEDEHGKVIITLMSTLMDEDNLETDPETDSIKHKESFFKEVEESFGDGGNKELIKERIDFVKNGLIERIKEAKVRRKQRRDSMSSISSHD